MDEALNYSGERFQKTWFRLADSLFLCERNWVDLCGFMNIRIRADEA